MLIGLTVAVAVLIRVCIDIINRVPAHRSEVHALRAVGLALIVAAAIELAYTLFTSGPDEALDPVTLGLSGALVLNLAQITALQWSQGVAAVLYVLALGGLFYIRGNLAKLEEPDTWTWSQFRHPIRTWKNQWAMQRRGNPDGAMNINATKHQKSPET